MMAQLAFMPPNTVSQHRSERIPNEVWEKYKVDIVREYQESGTKGALNWIKHQHIPDFLPRYVPSIELRCHLTELVEELGRDI